MKAPARIVLISAVALLVAAALGVAPAGSARKVEPYKPSIFNLFAPESINEDVVMHEGAVGSARVPRYVDSTPLTPYQTADGMTVYVSFSSFYLADAAVAQSYVDWLGRFTHGSELDGLQLYFYSPAEIAAVCGEGALACYSNDQIFFSAVEPEPGEPHILEVLAHEYGHHIAAHRLNPPWPAMWWGPKRWASQMNVCRNTADGYFFPGAETRPQYALNPGEGWAEAYRRSIEVKQGWADMGWNVVDNVFNPGPSELELVNLDVTEPWLAPTTDVARGKLRRNGVRRFKRYIYDGAMSASVTGARGISVSVNADGRILRGPARRVSFFNCSRKSVTVVVRSKFGGRYRLSTTQNDAQGWNPWTT